jgi:hypothetical protein
MYKLVLEQIKIIETYKYILIYLLYQFGRTDILL